MAKDNRKTNWHIDWILFALFLGSFLVDLTGLPLHEWLGAAAVILGMYHLLVHWSWVAAVTGRLLARTSLQARSYYLTDAGLLMGFLLTGASGLAISSWLDLPLPDFNAWSHLHLMASILTMLLVVLKIMLHWRWIVSAARRYVFAPNGSPAHPAPLGANGVGRRDFLKLMGIVGTAAAVAVHGALDGAQGSALGVSSSSQVESDSQQPASASSPTQAAEPAAVSSDGSAGSISTAQPTAAAPAAQCVVRCPNGCSYPGRCRRYRDGNANARCDLGECV
jgi:hypothetical protein